MATLRVQCDCVSQDRDATMAARCCHFMFKAELCVHLLSKASLTAHVLSFNAKSSVVWTLRVYSVSHDKDTVLATRCCHFMLKSKSCDHLLSKA